MQYIYGNTYPVKDQLRKLGGRWDSIRKAWKVPDHLEETAKRIVRGEAVDEVIETPVAVPEVVPEPPPPPPPPPAPEPVREAVYIPPRPCGNCYWPGAILERVDEDGKTGFVCERCQEIPAKELHFV